MGLSDKGPEDQSVMFKGLVDASLYPLRATPTSSIPVAFQATKVSSTIWHASLGHPNSGTLKVLLSCLPTLNKHVGFCES